MMKPPTQLITASIAPGDVAVLGTIYEASPNAAGIIASPPHFATKTLMLTNLRGLVERLELPASKTLMPLFEAISNAMDAIQERTGVANTGEIKITMLKRHDLFDGAKDARSMIDGFEIRDSGIGFTDANMTAFNEAYTRVKQIRSGGKGVGRFTYLKVFDSCEIDTVFEKDGIRQRRQFAFSIESESAGSEAKEATNEQIGTSIKLTGLREGYELLWQEGIEALAGKIIEHFLIRFAARSCPPIQLIGVGGETIELKEHFDTKVLPHIQETFFTAGAETLALRAFRRKGMRGKHNYVLCANGREVTHGNLTTALPELPDRLLDEAGDPYTLIVLVTGEYLDAHANQERTHIAFAVEEDDELPLEQQLLSRTALVNDLGQALRPLLVGDLESTNVEKLEQIDDFVAHTAPEYRVLMNERYRPLVQRDIAPGLKGQQLDDALLHLRRKVEDNLRKEERHVAKRMENESFEQYKEEFGRLMEDLNDVGKAKLAEYVGHRRIILDIFERSLAKYRENDKYPLERVLHQMIFPMSVTSKEVFLQQQNLWMIDERLCFHTILTSDKKLNSVSGLENTSGKEPDIFAFFYDTPIGVAEPDNLKEGGGAGTVVIVEFKRPGLKNYAADPGDPADQVIDRFREIRQGSVTDIDGRPVNPHNIRFIGYLIADLTPPLRNKVSERWHAMSDNEGYFLTLPKGDTYVEIISYDKLVRDAKRRNRVLFERLGIHKS